MRACIIQIFIIIIILTWTFLEEINIRIMLDISWQKGKLINFFLSGLVNLQPRNLYKDL
jgi:hypothetical protein